MRILFRHLELFVSTLKVGVLSHGFLVLVVLFSPAALAADSNQAFGFIAQPDRCIALHQGQVCFQKISFNWRTPADEEYCIFEEQISEPLFCWLGQQVSSYSMEFEADRSVHYQLRVKGKEIILSEVLVEVAWVYKSSRRSFSRWRLF